MGWGKATATLGLAAVLTGTLLAGVALHLDTAPARRITSALLEAALRDVEGVELTLDPWATARALLERDGPIMVAIPRLSVRRAVILSDRAPRLEPGALPSFAGRPVGLSIERLDIARAELGAPVPIEARIAGRLRAGGGLPALADVEIAARVGASGEAPLTAAAWLRGDELTAVIHAPRVEPALIAALVPEAPLRRPVAIAARVSGALAALELEARVTVPGEDPGAPAARGGAGEIAVQGRAAGLPPRWITAEARARELDPRAFHEEAPDTRVSAAAHAAIALDGAAPRGVAALRIEPLRISGQELPAASAWARFDGPALHGEAAIFQAGAPVAVTFASVSGGAIVAQSRVEIADLRRLAGLPLGAVRAEVAVITASPASPASRVAGLDLLLDEARLQGPGFAFVLAGTPSAPGARSATAPLRVSIGPDVRVSGDLWIRSGAVAFLGRQLALEPGRIRLREGRHPHLDLSASYPTSRGTRIRIRYRGDWDPALMAASALPSAP